MNSECKMLQLYAEVARLNTLCCGNHIQHHSRRWITEMYPPNHFAMLQTFGAVFQGEFIPKNSYFFKEIFWATNNLLFYLLPIIYYNYF